MLHIVEVEAADRTSGLVEALVAVWEGSVRATHDFLPEGEVERIGAMVPQAIAGVPTLLVCTRDDEPVAFLGMDGTFIEMLFVSAACRGQGIGRSLVECAVAGYGATEVSVNEQNPQAVGFYEHMGFTTYRRTDTDGEDAPYPLLFMRR
ncbi:GNAT family N-acetyltransferase [Collinsella tanakaei]|uniref:GNAT family N-acetyltransferase n=1 Tax=Collinsella tanakaei TaxID=626935 RepID=UPI0025A35C1A|nr:GNAT family N-acetyltransferase [Collinsella tanakaei]MDM8245640.1 GNAT family N-acetyltransferase [Collinsella tanakaei]